MVKNKNLIKRLGSLGFQLFESEEEVDANRVFADVVRSHDMRLLEGFSVVLANAAEKGLFNYEKSIGYLKKSQDRSDFGSLVAMSLAVYKSVGLNFSWAGKLHDMLDMKKRKERETYFDSLKKGNDFKFGGYIMSSLRLKKTFGDYFTRLSGPRLNDLLLEKEELGLEYALSQVFSPKQKDLFLKRLKGEKLTKTEKEYFSRVVKKKVLALANADLHRLAQKILE